MDISFHGLTVRPGDTLVLMADRRITAEEADTLSKQIRPELPDTVRVLILEGFSQMAVVLGREI